MKDRNVNAQLTYLAASAKPSLYRNGMLFTHRDRDGNDGVYRGVVVEPRAVVVNDGRCPDQGRRRLEVHGFELLARPLQRPDLQFFDHQQVVEDYYPECAEIVRQAANATRAFAFDHNVRSAADRSKRIAGGQRVQQPIHVVHGDYTLVSAPQRLRDLARPPGVNDTLRTALDEGHALLSPGLVTRTLDEGERFALINVWRNISHTPVMKDPLGLCDGQTVVSDELAVFEIRYHDRIGENYFARHSPRHEWWYYPDMTRDEVVLIKQWDSMGELARSGGAQADFTPGQSDGPCTFSLHTAFSDPHTPADAPERRSIEVRCVAFFD